VEKVTPWYLFLLDSNNTMGGCYVGRSLSNLRYMIPTAIGSSEGREVLWQGGTIASTIVK